MYIIYMFMHVPMRVAYLGALEVVESRQPSQLRRPCILTRFLCCLKE